MASDLRENHRRRIRWRATGMRCTPAPSARPGWQGANGKRFSPPDENGDASRNVQHLP